jgi:hypothetical protein
MELKHHSHIHKMLLMNPILSQTPLISNLYVPENVSVVSSRALNSALYVKTVQHVLILLFTCRQSFKFLFFFRISSLLRYSSTKYSNKNARVINKLNNINRNFYWRIFHLHSSLSMASSTLHTYFSVLYLIQSIHVPKGPSFLLLPSVSHSMMVFGSLSLSIRFTCPYYCNYSS